MCTNAISTFLIPDPSKHIFPAGMTSGEHSTATWKVAFPTIVLVALMDRKNIGKVVHISYKHSDSINS